MTAVATRPVSTSNAVLPDWRELCEISDEQLGALDIAVVNLACSVGLPGAEVIDVHGCLGALDSWSVGVRRVTEQGILTEFHENPAYYDNNVTLYRLVKLATVLERQCGLTYDPAKRGATDEDPFDLHEHFIYGPIQGPGGTCATLPLVHAAVGRRLGYPMRLVFSRGHMFCRWDDPVTGVRVNLDAAGNGVDCHPDDYYRKWPQPITPIDERLGGYLHSLTPRQELATFIGRRGIHWQEMGNARRAADAFALASRLDAGHLHWPHNIRRLQELWAAKLESRAPVGLPTVEVNVRRDRRRWPWMSWDVEKRFRFLEAVENLLNDKELEEQCWGPLRAGKQPAVALPSKIVVDST